jgi:hypothetical protein
MENPNPATRQLSAYATPAEIEELVAVLKAQWRECGRQMKEAAANIRPLLRQKGESNAAAYQRFCAMGKAEQERVNEVDCLQEQRRDINRLIKEIIDEGIVPWRWVYAIDGLPQLAAVMARYDAARGLADEAWHREVAATPVDDAAWEEELQWRRKCEDDRAHPERFVHRV